VILGEGLREMFRFAPEAAAKLTVVPNGLPRDGWTAPAPKRRREGQPLRLLYLSNLVETKGYLELVEACAILRGRGLDAHVDLVGQFLTSPDDRVVRSAAHAEQLLEQRIEALGLRDAVTYHGRAVGEAKRTLLEGADVFVLPTRYRFEGQPISIIEALAAALPVVSTRYRAIPDLVTDGGSGVLLDAPEPAALADAVERLAQPDTYAAASAVAWQAARTEFTAERFLTRMREVVGVAEASTVGAAR
jgi:glycosyltransferase involved in cell wall biosynthesis